MLFIFRVDASRVIGIGHVIRCLSLVDRLKSHGDQCVFVTREHDGHLAGLIQDQGLETHVLPMEPASSSTSGGYGHWLGGGWEADADATVAAFAGRRPDWVIVDHYAIDERWERRVRPHCHCLAAIDDLANRDHDCDLLLDQNAVASAEERYAGRVPSSCHLMLGPRYALLQPQYAELHTKARARGADIRRVLVYFGGADAHDLTGMAVQALLELNRPGVAVDVVANPAHACTPSIAERMRENSQFTLYGRLSTLAPLMMAADLAIGAGGTTTWERCCLGLPTLVVTIADNQVPAAAELHRRGLILWLGHASDVSSETMRQELMKVLDQGTTAGWSQECRALVDGQGASRVAKELWQHAE
jgi:UDP-2,4-diacetamido-2,4,6-trideoxy-beta-L-altropyranose hydrolase